VKKIVIDPITRIEGHLRAEVEIDEDGIVKEAYVSGQLFRGIEIILKGRDPRDAGLFSEQQSVLLRMHTVSKFLKMLRSSETLCPWHFLFKIM
jgi:quinone-reactive Ni/Fe-hydrogenase large subunit